MELFLLCSWKLVHIQLPALRFFVFRMPASAVSAGVTHWIDPSQSPPPTHASPYLKWPWVLGCGGDALRVQWLLALLFDAFLRNTETSYFATSIKRNARFHPSRPPSLASKIHQKIMFFHDTFLDLLFLDFMLIYVEKVRFWTPLKNRMAPKWHPKSHFFNINHVNFRFMRSPFLRHRNECFPRRPWSAPGLIFHDFWRIFTPFQASFWRVLNDSWHRFLY